MGIVFPNIHGAEFTKIYKINKYWLLESYLKPDTDVFLIRDRTSTMFTQIYGMEE